MNTPKSSANSHTSLFTKPLFWCFFALASGIAAFTSYYYFPKAFPIVDVTITTNRYQVLEKARSLAQNYNLGPQDFEQSLYFTSSQHLQNYIELEAGGKEAWAQLISQNIFKPYTWCIRHYKEGTTNETLIQLTPTGESYGFDEQLSETQVGAALTAQEAQHKAEHFLTSLWHVDITSFTLIDTSSNTVSSGRIDHTFTYQHTSVHIGQAHYRLSVIVSGDKITKVHHYMYIPEAFSRRYEAMRSANNIIAHLASVAMYLLYIFLGCIVALLILTRRNKVVIRPAFTWAIIIAGASALATLTQLPLIWCSYNTAQSAYGYLLQHLVSCALGFTYATALYFISFASAESLTRVTFKNHVQFWRLWKNPLSSSFQVLGQTVAAYLLVSFLFLFLIGFYLVGTTYLGFWDPSQTLTDPNILSTYAPWLSALSQAYAAGFWEECLFRAVPICLCTLIGQKLGNRKLGLTIGFILQAIIFAAAHANYPAQPAYTRVLELSLASFFFGAIYIAYGLLPVIIIHSVYDAILMSLPIFISDAPGIFYNKLLVIVGILLPLIVVLYARLRNGTWSWSPDYTYNKAWQNETKVNTHAIVSVPSAPVNLSTKSTTILIILALGIAASTLITKKRTPDAPALTIDAPTAVAKAREVLEKQHIHLDTTWKAIPKAITSPDQTSFFIWQQSKKEYTRLADYLPMPGWTVRFARFEGDLLERAEEYSIKLTYDGTVKQITHQLPETQAGKELTQEQARSLALEHIRNFYKLNSHTLKELCASSTKKPSRKDWLFTFQNTQLYTLDQGQARITVEIAGDQVVNSNRYIYTPEQWDRKQYAQSQTAQAIELFQFIVMLLLYVVALTLALRVWQQNKLVLKPLYFFGLLVGVSTIILAANNWYSLLTSFSTTEPFMSQIIEYVTSQSLRMVLAIVQTVVLIASVYSYPAPYYLRSYVKNIWVGISFGVIFTGIITIINYFFKPLLPIWPVFTAVDTYLPLLGFTFNYVLHYTTRTALFLVIALIGQKSLTKLMLSTLALSIILTPFSSFQSWLSWLIILFLVWYAVCIIFYTINKLDRACIPIMALISYAVTLIHILLYPSFVGSTFASLITLGVLSVFSLGWSYSLTTKAQFK